MARVPSFVFQHSLPPHRMRLPSHSMRKFFFSALLLLGFALTSTAQPHMAIDALYGAQDSFCKTATSDGEKAAFLSALTDDGIIFRPAPVKGLQFWQQDPGAQPTTVDRKLAIADL